ncbi:DNA repair protein RadC [Rhizobiaceae bacterium]|nr:DNA repair protein RadC [Rhizobiaceae bacterium]
MDDDPRDAQAQLEGFGEATAGYGNVVPRKDWEGHRTRLRERFDAGGSGAMPDYELLELLLYRFVPRRDTKPIAKRLIARFGTLYKLLGATQSELREVEGIGPMCAQDLKIVQAIIERALRRQLDEAPLLGSWSAVIDYCMATLAHNDVEQFRAFFLDKRNHLIADETLHTGTVDHTPVYPREVVRRALHHNATALIIVHNHPSGDPTPSRADIEMTTTLMDIAKGMNIVVHDHIIVGRSGHASFKGLKLI